MTAEYPEKLAELIDFLQTSDRSDRMETLIGIADRFKEVPEAVATRPFSKDHLTPACESEAYVWATPRDDGTLAFHFAVENPQGISAKAMAVILQESLSGLSPKEICELSGDVVYQIFGNELSMGKSMGLTGMVAMVRNFARKYVAALEARDSVN